MYAGFAAAQFRKFYQEATVLGKLNEWTRQITLANGVVITCRKSFNREDIFISVPKSSIEGYTEKIKKIHAFAIHPRTTEHPSGVDLKKTTVSAGTKTYTNLTGMVTYSVVDDDHGTHTLWLNNSINNVPELASGEWVVAELCRYYIEQEYADGQTLRTKVDFENYGNISWSFSDHVITWLGLPSLTVGIRREVSVEGVTDVDVQTDFATYYTPLRSHIYESGVKISTPGKVRGAGYDGSLLLIVTTVNYTQYDFVGSGEAGVNPVGLDWQYDNRTQSTDPITGITTYEYPEIPTPHGGKKGNYFDELWVRVGSGTYYVNGRLRTAEFVTQEGSSITRWLRIGYRVSSIPNLHVWFTENKAEAQPNAKDDEGIWVWSSSRITNPSNLPQGSFSSTFTYYPPEHRTETVDVGGDIVCDVSWHTSRMHTKSANITLHIENTHTNIAEVAAEDGAVIKDVKVYLTKRADPVGYYIQSGPSATEYVIELQAINFKSGPYTWGGGAVPKSPGSFDATFGNIPSCIPPNQMYNITVTDNCGLTAAITITPNGIAGQWLVQGYTRHVGNNGCYGGFIGSFVEYSSDLSSRTVGPVYRCYNGGADPNSPFTNIANPPEGAQDFWIDAQIQTWVCV